MLMTTEELAIFIEIKNCLSETLAKVKEVYGDSGYYQRIEYKADNDKYENWLFRAREAVRKGNEFLKS